MEHKDFGVRVEIPNEPKTVVIEHDQWGRVEGVTPAYENWEKEPHCWFKAGADYPKRYGWREVKPKRWVPVEVAIKEGGLVALANVNNNKFMPRHFNLDPGYRWKTVEIEKEVEG